MACLTEAPEMGSRRQGGGLTLHQALGAKEGVREIPQMDSRWKEAGAQCSDLYAQQGRNRREAPEMDNLRAIHTSLSQQGNGGSREHRTPVQGRDRREAPKMDNPRAIHASCEPIIALRAPTSIQHKQPAPGSEDKAYAVPTYLPFKPASRGPW